MNCVFRTDIGDQRLSIMIDPCSPDPAVEFDNFSEAEREAWLEGAVFGFELETRCNHCGEYHFEDSCWGFYGQESVREAMPDHLDEKWHEVVTGAMF